MIQLAQNWDTEWKTAWNEAWEPPVQKELHPEAVKLLRERFPVGCTIEIVESDVKCEGIKGKLIEIDDAGRFYINDDYHRYTFGLNKFKRIT
jgi:hypothetical protein